jgi:hypothetical protein
LDRIFKDLESTDHLLYVENCESKAGYGACHNLRYSGGRGKRIVNSSHPDKDSSKTLSDKNKNKKCWGHNSSGATLF